MDVTNKEISKLKNKYVCHIDGVWLGQIIDTRDDEILIQFNKDINHSIIPNWYKYTQLLYDENIIFVDKII